jgi:hypothetical protein
MSTRIQRSQHRAWAENRMPDHAINFPFSVYSLNPYPQQRATVRKVHPMANKGAQKPLGATNSELKPGEYPFGSPQSRATARALLERRFAGRRRIDVVSSVPRPGANGEIRIGTWIEGADGSLFRFSTIPAGMTVEDAERIAAEDRGETENCPTGPAEDPVTLR